MLIKDEYDLIIVGAGILGCAAAVAFGKQERNVLLIERDLNEPDRIVGELLQPGGVIALEKLGLAECLENIDSISCHGYVVFRDGQYVQIPYPDRSDGQPGRGRSFHHGRFVMNLRKAAAAESNVTIYEGIANEVILCPITDRAIGVSCSKKGESEVTINFFAPLTIIADGCFSKFRKEFIPKQVTVKSNFVGFVMTDSQLPYQNYGHVALGKISPILMYQISTEHARVLVDVPGKLPSNGTGALKKYLEEVVLPDIPKSLQTKFYEALKTERLRSMPNSFLPPSTNVNEGLILLGDAMNMRHPLTGGGMTVAFNDVVTLSELLHPSQIPDFSDTGLILSKMQTFHWRRKEYCSVINILAQALYTLFSANDENLRVLREGCFEYFLLGGRCISDPCGLLSGLRPKPMILIGHFFAVAVYSIYCFFAQSSILSIPQNIIKSFMVLYTACLVILPLLWTECQP
ncbi:4692_t:CDS:10 [Ambispora gerdemannii]|uniref:Squalene monooxygenase n=1 Tax=Ambispora gerdemannii TaxID=144530 RepID=A0A9N8V7K4_9GLOM|nr:4692_t:CDS:10 [Ambispora gerdemannii]